MMEEKTYRARVREMFERIERAFAEIDPDVAECESVQGALTITKSDRSKLVVSPQPSLRQIWLAIASEAKGYRFDYDEGKGAWVDDRGAGVELLEAVMKGAGVGG